MGKRSRKRSDDARRAPAAAPAPESPRPPRAPGRPVDVKARREEAPAPPWAPVPLTEIATFAGLVLVLIGFFAGGDSRPTILIVGFTLVSAAAAELAVREHFAGYRSHSALIAALCAIIAAGALYPTPLPQEALLVVGVLVFAGAFVALRRAFAARAGGLKFRA